MYFAPKELFKNLKMPDSEKFTYIYQTLKSTRRMMQKRHDFCPISARIGLLILKCSLRSLSVADDRGQQGGRKSCGFPLEGKNMKLFKLKKTFVEDEDGAVTVDWVVLTAAIVGIAVAVIALLRDGIKEAATDIYQELTGAIN
ncbi:hypothetical protein [Halovulum sp. GXIMD14793]